jgi:hypothetical protein
MHLRGPAWGAVIGGWRNSALSRTIILRERERRWKRPSPLNPDLVTARAAYTTIESDAGHAEAAMVRLLGQASKHENNAEIFSALVHACRYCGLMDASLRAHERAIRLDPNIRTSVAHTCFALGDFARALYWYGSNWGLYLDVLALASMGRREESAALL